MTAKRVVLAVPGGQTSNQLWTNLWLESFCHQEGIVFENVTLGRLGWIWGRPGTLGQRLRALLYFGAVRLRIVHPFQFEQEDLARDYQEYLKSANFRTLLVQGWGFRSPETVQKYAAYFRDKYRPRLRPEVQAALEAKASGFEVVLGVHLRGRDYRTWRNGEFFFSASQYRAWTDQFLALQPTRRVKVILFSDEPIDTEAFRSLTVPWEVSTGTLAEDYVLMGLCTYLLGPPSTFTLWASFLGDNTCIQLRSSHDTMAQALTERVVSPYR